MITADGFFDWAVRLPGPAHGQNGGRNGGLGMIPHSAEGDWTGPQNVLDFLTSRVNAPPGKRASWAASNMKGGIFYQHYSIWAQTWTSGADYPNNNFFAFENEGRAGQPLTQPQVANIIRAGRELQALQGWKPRRPINSQDKTASLYEHNECVRWGADATACPSGRIPWNIIVPALLAPEEADMKSFLAWCPDYGGGSIWFIGPNGAKWITDPTVVAELERQFGKMSVVLSSRTINTIGG